MKHICAIFILLVIPWPRCSLSAKLSQPVGQNVERGAGEARLESEEGLQQQLAETGRTMILSLRSGKPYDLLRFWSSRGVAVGIDGPTISKNRARNEFRSKKYLYCLLFDTRCLQKEDEQDRKRAGMEARQNPLRSYRELLLQTPSPKIETYVTRQGLTWGGQLRIFINEGQKAALAEEQSPLEFLFGLQNGQWKLTAIMYN